MDIDRLKKHIIEEVPRYSYLNSLDKKSQYRYLKFKFANWVMEDKLMGTVRWYQKLLEILAENESS